MFTLEPDMADTFARATRLSRSEVIALTLASLSDRYPPLDPAFCGRQRQPTGIFVKENWVFFHTTRYCPDCLAGDESLIQQRHGGAWQLHWRLPVVFACTTHRRLLHHACPRCHRFAHLRVPGRAHPLVPMATYTGLHPAQCRTPLPAPQRPYEFFACAARLDNPTPVDSLTSGEQQELLDLQTRLLALLATGAPATTRSAGQNTSSRQYFVDLRIMSCLITASWPAAQNLLDQPSHSRLLRQHISRTRGQIQEIRHQGRTVRERFLYDNPPLDAATCAALLTLADRILTGDVDAVRGLLHPMLARASAGMKPWIRQFLTGTGHCSPGLRTALGVELGYRDLLQRTGIRLPELPPSPPPRPVPFGIQHIPQHLLPEWHTEHLARFATDVKPRLLRRAAAARLAQLCVGGSAAEAGALLGIPYHASAYALSVIRRQLRSNARRGFDAAIDALADCLNTATDLTDYGMRREELKTWSISPREWAELTSGLRDQQFTRGSRWPGRPYVDWDDSKRILASMWVWVRITGGEHLFAPAIRPDLRQSRPARHHRSEIHNRWPHISSDNPHGHYAPLRERLDAYADLLTAKIDNQPTQTDSDNR